MHQCLILQGAHPVKLQHPDVPPERWPHLGVLQALEEERLLRLVFEGLKPGVAEGSWSAWLLYEVLLHHPTHKTRGCEFCYSELQKMSTCYIHMCVFFFFFCLVCFCAECWFFSHCNRKFDQDLESVSTGLKRLKRLSKAFDDIIGRDDR